MQASSSDRSKLRKTLIARREALPDALRMQHTAAIHAALRPLLEGLAVSRVGFCWPYRGEVDLRPALLAWLAAAPRRLLALPVVPDQVGALEFRHWFSDTPLASDRFGIPAPIGTPRVEPELLLVPVNGFDARGYRLGYGGGFFDRTLAALQPAPITVGVGFELSRLTQVDAQAHDRPLDWILTEDGCQPCQREDGGIAP
ncbi:MAG: 5-formyltetrahydrofolate cyclo-ligase [Candidatus Dactylopiibacterium carminicum]|uniref:5-formyltetrahydrofolate cyclo-ligase n=1 Tax=Candidatus Dactylopiibacterium carminicum TaxID=857335 RepID=A0A272EUF2_9RHOO|nr:5-formyltetrahydrofolate cyclo-ligase [Candidatus Dactylopiibacterium carminicum]KAF7599775.1 5-formyltetrahydrofolate cyclo-ligase [Candidatus Dactylopiibacterium carminicum]PAS93729.1 MAG: 5-formyltetrahydrofolate cyclo-ligase [Candidatus Dactylopiibacterium carminicum]PAS98270.1 MAG: 5-formyltetrahydrofolate cyclo-ligase [Candidatus Dactylopiibacterium carminicum]PAS99776.1 MAG: 5-formyltetrahydrofolate cyclo-ligase [Candidatus Dactylopiibacterium carminicum]